MGFFKKARDMYALQKQAKTIKKELSTIHIEAESEGIMVTVTGEQEFVSLTIPDAVWESFKNDSFGKKKFQDTLIKLLNKTTKKAQEIGNTKMKVVWDQLGVAQ